jgi:hypothetical protein
VFAAVTDMADICLVVASGSAVGVVDLFSPGSCPEGSKSDFEYIFDGCIP